MLAGLPSSEGGSLGSRDRWDLDVGSFETDQENGDGVVFSGWRGSRSELVAAKLDRCRASLGRASPPPVPKRSGG